MIYAVIVVEKCEAILLYYNWGLLYHNLKEKTYLNIGERQIISDINADITDITIFYS